jgi:hypothetical protein
MRLYDAAKIIRSKNAGPFSVTVDIMLESAEMFDRVLASPALKSESIAALYGAAPEKVRVIPARRMRTIKVTMPRAVCSGAPGDTDVYGSQQHFPLAGMEI